MTFGNIRLGQIEPDDFQLLSKKALCKLIKKMIKICFGSKEIHISELLNWYIDIYIIIHVYNINENYEMYPYM